MSSSSEKNIDKPIYSNYQKSVEINRFSRNMMLTIFSIILQFAEVTKEASQYILFINMIFLVMTAFSFNDMLKTLLNIEPNPPKPNKVTNGN